MRKDKNFDKTKTWKQSNQRLWSIGLTKQSLMTHQRLVSQIQIHYHNPVNLALTSYSYRSQFTSLQKKPKQKKKLQTVETFKHVSSPHKKSQLHITQYKATTTN